MSALAEIIARLEKAVGPDRELDVEIATVIGFVRHRDGNYLHTTDGGRVLESDYYDNGGNAPELSHYTSSIGDALTLVPEGWQWLVSNRAPKPHKGRAFINNRELHFSGIGGMAPNPKYSGEETTAATPAIALAIVCLRARSAMENR